MLQLLFSVLILIPFVFSSTSLTERVVFDSTEKAGSSADLRWIGMLNRSSVVFIRESQAHLPANINISYWWKNSTNSTSSIFHQSFIANSSVVIVQLQHLTDLRNICVRIEDRSKEEECRKVDEDHLDIPKPFDVRMVSTNYNYSLIWKINHSALSKEISFQVEYLNEDIPEEDVWLQSNGCGRVLEHHCDMFSNNFDPNDRSCPDNNVAGGVRARVRPCLTRLDDACGLPVEAIYFFVRDQGVIAQPTFSLSKFVVENRLQITNEPHLVVFSKKSLNCYYSCDLVYSIKYYNVNNGIRIEQDRDGIQFDRRNISLLLDRVLKNNTEVCVEMRIETSSKILKSDWSKRCTTVLVENVVSKTPISTGESESSVLYPLLVVCLSALLLLSIALIIFKIDRYCKSLNFDIPSELEEIKKEMENQMDSFCVDASESHECKKTNREMEAMDIADPLTPAIKRAAKLSLLSVLNPQVKRNNKQDAETTPLYPSSQAPIFFDDHEDPTNSVFSDADDSLSYIFQVNSSGMESELTQPMSSPSYAQQSTSLEYLHLEDIKNQPTGSSELAASSYNHSSPEIAKSDDSSLVLKSNRNHNSTAAFSITKKSPFVKRSLSRSSLNATGNSKFPESKHGLVFSVNDIADVKLSLEPKHSKKECSLVKLDNPTYKLLSTERSCNLGRFSLKQKQKPREISKVRHHSLNENTFVSLQRTSQESNSASFVKSEFLTANDKVPKKHQEHPAVNQGTIFHTNDSKFNPERTQRNKCIKTCINCGYLFEANDPNSILCRRHEEVEEPMAPSYVLYERSRKDSFRSGDSGLPCDWSSSFSDDSVTPPQSPDDFYIAQSQRYRFNYSSTGHRLLQSSSGLSEPHSKLKIAKEPDGHVVFTYELQPILSGIEEDVQQSQSDFNSNRREYIDHYGEGNCENLNYLRLSALSQLQNSNKYKSNVI